MLRPPPRSHCARLFAVLLLFLPASALANATDNEAESLSVFEKHVRPTLVEHCLRCHGEKKQQGGLRLDSRAGWMTGGDSGPAIIAGDPERSLLIAAIRYQNTELEMPPKGALPESTVAAFTQWVKLGAFDPRDSKPSSKPSTAPPTIEQGRNFWSFQPVQRPPVPAVHHPGWPRSDIDRFILARLEQSGLMPVADADRRTLIRRVYFDLIGLPPTPRQIDEFLEDDSATAYAALIDQLLDSPQFGERWGRHWLDVVRFAESSGGGRTLLFPDAWRYRDYVIESFNNDLPYDQFLQEQIAGDLLESQDWEDKRRKLTATAFLLLGPTNFEMQDKDILEMDVVDEQLDTIGKSMLGMTIGCARCHDHKFDPIPADDYYAMAGILKSTKAMIHSNVSQWNTVELPLDPEQQAAIARHEESLAAAKADLEKATAKWVAAGGKPEKKKKTAKAASVDAKSISGIVIDDPQAKRIGQWTESVSIAGYVGERYIHDGTADKGSKSVVYQPKLPRSGKYEVRVSYTKGPNRSTRVPVHIFHRDGESIVRVNQQQTPTIDGTLTSLGTFDFDPTIQPRVVISNEGTEDGVVIADAVVFLSVDVPRLPTPAEVDAAENIPSIVQDAGKLPSVAVEDKALLKRLKAEVDLSAKKVKLIENAAPKRPTAMATEDDADPGDIHLAIAGVVSNQGPITSRGGLRVATQEPFPSIPDGQSGRRELAQWISSEHNPLTARVMANRVWHWLIGQGIVSTVDNFGSVGQPPSHSELLDHLASTFVDDGWSVKALIRKIMLSRVYQLQSNPSESGNRLDLDNRLLWRMNRKRLRAEDIRDTLLLVSGNLDVAVGGSNIKQGTSSEYGYQFQSKRRSVYVPVFRNTLPELFEVFDFADPNIQRGRRNSSTVASQALLMMNHPFVIEQSQAAAKNLLQSEELATIPGIRQAYHQVLGRDPGDEELSIAVAFIESASDNDNQHSKWSMLYQTLFQCVDFRYLK